MQRDEFIYWKISLYVDGCTFRVVYEEKMVGEVDVDVDDDSIFQRRHKRGTFILQPSLRNAEMKRSIGCWQEPVEMQEKTRFRREGRVDSSGGFV